MDKKHLMPVSKENADHYNWGDHCEGWRFVDDPGISVIQERMPPGASEVSHFHERAKQFFFILNGRAEVSLDGKETVLHPGMGIEIASQCKHHIRNPGPDILEFILVSSPNTHDDRVNL